MTLSPRTTVSFFAILFLFWAGFHIPAISYGTHDIPLHQSYVGDEQSPINGALHILQDKSLLAFRDLNTVYYGPVFSFISLPGVVGDFVIKYVTGAIHSANEYKNIIIWNWGGIILLERIIAVLVGFIGVLGFYKLLSTISVNPKQIQIPVYLGTLLFAFNFYYFEYTSYWKHWAIIIPVLIWQLYLLIRFEETQFKNKYLVYSALLFFVSFGVSYMGALFEVMWLPLLVRLVRARQFIVLKSLLYFFLSLFFLSVVVIWWHPHAFWRISGLITSDIANTSQATYTTEKSSSGLSFGYYTDLIVRNHIAYLLLLLILLIGARAKRIFGDIGRRAWVLPAILTFFVSYTVFGLVSHHESRYALPSIALLITSIACLLPVCFEYKEMIFIRRLVYILCAWIVVYNIVYIILWSAIMNKGPIEQQALQKVITFEENHSSAKTLAIQYYLFGHVHTKEAYMEYAKSFKKDSYNLYKTIFETELPHDVFAINAYYIRPDDSRAFKPKTLQGYDQVVYKYEPRVELNQFDFFDEDLARLWWYNELSPQYFFLK